MVSKYDIVKKKKGKVPRMCLIGPRTLGENVRNCYGGWRKR